LEKQLVLAQSRSRSRQDREEPAKSLDFKKTKKAFLIATETCDKFSSLQRDQWTKFDTQHDSVETNIFSHESLQACRCSIF